MNHLTPAQQHKKNAMDLRRQAGCWEARGEHMHATWLYLRAEAEDKKAIAEDAAEAAANYERQMERCNEAV